MVLSKRYSTPVWEGITGLEVVWDTKYNNNTNIKMNSFISSLRTAKMKGKCSMLNEW